MTEERIRRYAAAFLRGRAKIRQPISEIEALNRAFQVLSQLPDLDRTDVIEIGS